MGLVFTVLLIKRQRQQNFQPFMLLIKLFCHRASCCSEIKWVVYFSRRTRHSFLSVAAMFSCYRK
jgi:hypothetical protein